MWLLNLFDNKYFSPVLRAPERLEVYDEQFDAIPTQTWECCSEYRGGGPGGGGGDFCNTLTYTELAHYIEL